MIRLEAQSLVVVCPDCGQRYDPAKAAKIARVRTRDGRTIKPGRVEAQDVREQGHRTGYHHRAHHEATRAALDGWAPLLFAPVLGAFNEHTPLMQLVIRLGPELTRNIWQVAKIGILYAVRAEEIASIAIEIEEPRWRAHVERVARAAQAVREDHPWWRAYLHELGVSAEEIAHGLVIGRDARADVFFERRPQAIPAPGLTLRGLL